MNKYMHIYMHIYMHTYTYMHMSCVYTYTVTSSRRSRNPGAGISSVGHSERVGGQTREVNWVRILSIDQRRRRRAALRRAQALTRHQAGDSPHSTHALIPDFILLRWSSDDPHADPFVTADEWTSGQRGKRRRTTGNDPFNNRKTIFTY